MKLNVVKQTGKKSGKEYLALQVDLGYRKALLSFDTTLISEISGMSFADLHALNVDCCVCVGEIVKKAAK